MNSLKLLCRQLSLVFIALLAVMGSLPAAEKKAIEPIQEEECSVPGSPAAWVEAYCLYKVSADDNEAPAVKACVKEAAQVKAVAKMSDCLKKEYWKTQLCVLQSKEKKEQDRCANDASFIPLSVQFEMKN